MLIKDVETVVSISDEKCFKSGFLLFLFLSFFSFKPK